MTPHGSSIDHTGRYVLPDDRPRYLPTPDEIDAGRAEIQSRWSDRTRRERAGVHANPAVETRTVADPRPLTGDA